MKFLGNKLHLTIPVDSCFVFVVFCFNEDRNCSISDLSIIKTKNTYKDI